MFKPISDKVSLPDLEKEMIAYWKTHRIFEKSVEGRQNAPDYTFYEGPPTANGKPDIHHVFARTIKDLVCRYQTMRGYQVHRKAGWDTHGLPVEIEVEKKLGLKHKGEIEKYGIAKFNAECRKSVFEYKDMWEDLTWRMGYWIDMEHPYITCENDYLVCRLLLEKKKSSNTTAVLSKSPNKVTCSPWCIKSAPLNSGFC